MNSSDLKQQRSFIRRRVSRFLQLFIVMVFRARQGRLLGSVIHLLFRWLNNLFWKGRGAGAQLGSGHKAARVDCYIWKNRNVESLPHYLPWLVDNYSSWVFHNYAKKCLQSRLLPGAHNPKQTTLILGLQHFFPEKWKLFSVLERIRSKSFLLPIQQLFILRGRTGMNFG